MIRCKGQPGNLELEILSMTAAFTCSTCNALEGSFGFSVPYESKLELCIRVSRRACRCHRCTAQIQKWPHPSSARWLPSRQSSEEINKILATLKAGRLELNIFHCSAAMTAFREADGWKSALDFVHRMRSWAVLPDDLALATAHHSLGKSDPT